MTADRILDFGAEEHLARGMHDLLLRMYAVVVMCWQQKCIFYVGGITYEGKPRATLIRIRLEKFLSGAKLTDADFEILPPGESGFPPDIAQHTATLVDDKIYVIGSYCDPRTRFFVIDTKTSGITEVYVRGRVEPNLHCHSAVSVETAPSDDPLILIFGGASYTTPQHHLYKFFPATNRVIRVQPRSDARPSARLYHSACVLKDGMFIFGGAPEVKSTTESDPVFDDMWHFSLSEQIWKRIEQKGQVPSKRGSAAMHVVDERIYLFGGFDGARSLSDLHQFCPDSHIWFSIGITSAPRSMPLSRSCSTMSENGITASPLQTGISAWDGVPDADEVLHVAPQESGDSALDNITLDANHIGGRWAAATCMLDRDTILIAGGFASTLEDPRKADLCSRIDTLRILPPSLKKLCVEIVAVHSSHFEHVLAA